MPIFPTTKLATDYAVRHYLRPTKPKETIYGNWEVHETYDIQVPEDMRKSKEV